MVGIAKLGVIVAVFALVITAAAVVMKPAEALGQDQIVITTGMPSVYSPNPLQMINITVANVNSSANITGINITLPTGFAFSAGSNVTNGSFVAADPVNFSSNSATRVIQWNSTLDGSAANTFALVPPSTATNFSFKVQVANWTGGYPITVWTTTNDSAVNMTVVVVTVDYSSMPGKTQWSFCGSRDSADDRPLGCVGPGISNEGGMFFWDSSGGDTNQNVTLAVNLTSMNPTLTTKAMSNITLWINFTELGFQTNPTVQNFTQATYSAVTGLYSAVGFVNMSGAQYFTGGSLRNSVQSVMINMTWSTSTVSGNESQMRTNVMLVNMSTFGCPPADDARANAMWGQMSVPFYVSATNTTTVSPAGCVDYSSNSTGCAAAYALTTRGLPPVTFNGTRYLMCSPNFDSTQTTNFSDIVRTRSNMSNITLSLYIPNTGSIVFDSNTNNGIDFTSPDSMGGIMDFAIKALVMRGMIGVNESEFNGLNTSGRDRPNLTQAATLKIFNASGIFGFSRSRIPTVGYGSYNGSNMPTGLIECNSTKCSSVSFDGINLSFGVSSWSTYVISDVNYTMQFTNFSGTRVMYRPVNTSVGTASNATFWVNITNNGNATGEYYNLSFYGLPECDQEAAAGGWSDISNDLTAGCLRYNMSAQHNNGSIIYLLAGASKLLQVNYTANSTPGTYTFGLVARHINSTNFTETFWNLNSTSDGVAFTVVTGIFAVTSPVNRSNISVANNLNVYFTNFSNIRHLNWTINGTVEANGVIRGNTTNTTSPLLINSTNFTSQSSWMNVQSITLWYNDTWGNANYTNLSVTIDDSYAKIYHQTYASNASNMTGSVLINATVSQNISGTHSVWITLKNSTSGYYDFINLTDYNATFGPQSNWTKNLSTTAYADGLYNITFWARGWNNLVNTTPVTASSSGWIWIDNNAPSITLSVPSGTIGSGMPATITCSSNDGAGYGVANTSCTVAKPIGGSASCTCSSSSPFTDTSTAGFYTVTYIATDHMGKVSTTTATFGVGGGSSGGTGGGSGGGGGGTTSSSMTDSFSISAIAAGVMQAFNISKDIDITNVEVTPVNSASSVSLTVSKYTGMPTDVSGAPAGTVYSYLSVNTVNLANSNIQGATIKFRVPRSWITSNIIDISTLRLNRYVNGAWEALPTAQTSTDSDYIYFSATTAGFSYFAITASPAAAPAPGTNATCTNGAKRCSGSLLQECISNGWATASTCTNGCNSSTLTCNSAAGTVAPPAADSGIWLWVVAIVVIVVVVGLVYFFVAR